MDIATSYHHDSIRHSIKESIELEMWKQYLIRYLATVNIILAEADIDALKIRFNNLEMKVKSNLHE